MSGYDIGESGPSPRGATQRSLEEAQASLRHAGHAEEPRTGAIGEGHQVHQAFVPGANSRSMTSVGYWTSEASDADTNLGARLGALDQPQPPCPRCDRGWRLPRNIAYVDEEAKKVDRIKAALTPNTPHTVISHTNFNAAGHPFMDYKVFENVPLSYHEKGMRSFLDTSLVSSFWYNTKTGDVDVEQTYQKKSQKERREHVEELDNKQSEWLYARLISLPQWYLSLFSVIGVVTLEILDTQANLLVIVDILYDKPVWMDQFPDSPHIFTVGYLLLTICCSVLAVKAAKDDWEHKAGPQSGDIITTYRRPTRLLVFVAIFFFKYFAVENLVTDIVILLHPWKSIQPYTAFKTEGSRVYALGYQSSNMYEVENRRGQWHTMSLRLVQKTFTFSVKAWFAVWLWITGDRSISLLMSVLGSLGSVILGWANWNYLRRERKKLRKHLLSVIGVHDAEAVDHTMDTDSKRRRDTAVRLLNAHFGITTSDPTHRPQLRDSTIITSEGEAWALPKKTKATCEGCGRGKAGDSAATQVIVTTQDRLHKRFKPDQRVCLNDAWSDDDLVNVFHDALYGPLDRGEVGVVKAYGPQIAGIGYRCLVWAEKEEDYRGEKGCWREWWYDQDALVPFEAQVDAVSTIPPAEGALSPSAHEDLNIVVCEKDMRRILEELCSRKGTKWLEEDTKWLEEELQMQKMKQQEYPSKVASLAGALSGTLKTET